MLQKSVELRTIVEACYPVEKAEIFKNGSMILMRKSKLSGSYYSESNRRGKITKMSNKSLSRLILYAQETDVQFNSMLTLTYGRYYPHSGQIVKSDLNFITQWIKKSFNASYLWFLEFQERGAPHVHVLLSIDSISPRARALVGLKWTERLATSEWFLINCPFDRQASQIRNIAGVACHEKTWELLRSTDGARRYITKYASKAMQKEVPEIFQDVGRFWGVSRDVIPSGIVVDISENDLRDQLMRINHPTAKWEVLPKVIFNLRPEVNGA